MLKKILIEREGKREREREREKEREREGDREREGGRGMIRKEREERQREITSCYLFQRDPPGEQQPLCSGPWALQQPGQAAGPQSVKVANLHNLFVAEI